MGKGDIKLKCTGCGHIMNAARANILNQMRGISYWTCSECGKKFTVRVSVMVRK